MIKVKFIKKLPVLNCPPATEDLKLNTENRNKAIKEKHIQYGPLNLSDEAYWERLSDHWGTTPSVVKESRCGNCVAFDISPRMLECLPGPVSEPIEDADGKLGYCWMHHFKCHSARSCYTWAGGGPISDDNKSAEWQKKSGMLSERTKTPQDPDVKDKPGTQPKKYYKGLSKATKEKRAKQFRKGVKDDSPSAYKPAPGDKDAKTKPSEYTKKFKDMFGEEVYEEQEDLMMEIGDKAEKALKNKAKKANAPLGALKAIYRKGLAAWKTGHRPGASQHAWAMARVNSVLTGGGARKVDDAQWKQIQKHRKKGKKKK